MTEMKFEPMKAFPPNENPFHHDAFHMGTKIAANLMILHANFPDEKAKYVILVNTETGERTRVRLTT